MCAFCVILFILTQTTHIHIYIYISDIHMYMRCSQVFYKYIYIIYIYTLNVILFIGKFCQVDTSPYAAAVIELSDRTFADFFFAESRTGGGDFNG